MQMVNRLLLMRLYTILTTRLKEVFGAQCPEDALVIFGQATQGPQAFITIEVEGRTQISVLLKDRFWLKCWIGRIPCEQVAQALPFLNSRARKGIITFDQAPDAYDIYYHVPIEAWQVLSLKAFKLLVREVYLEALSDISNEFDRFQSFLEERAWAYNLDGELDYEYEEDTEE